MGCSLKVKNSYYYSLSIILIFVLLFSFFTIVRGDDVTQIGFSPSQINVQLGSDFSIDIICAPTQPIKAYEFQLQFNPSYLEVLSVSEGDIFEGYSTFFNNGTINNNQGVITDIYGLIIGQGNVSSQGSLVKVSFHAKSNIGISTLSLLNVGITNELGYISFEKQNGEIIIYDPASPHVISPINLVNKSQNIALNISELSVAIYDLESNTFDWMIYTSPNIGNNSGINSLNGTKTCSISGLEYSTTYNWYVHCKDLSAGEWTNKSFWFKTIAPPGGNGGNNGYNPPFIPSGDIDENNPPGQPSKPVGPTSIEIGVVYSYSSSAMDNDEDLVRLKFDWGDGNQSDWSDYVSSNITVEMNHYWDIISNYDIRVLAQDQQGDNSTWSEPLEVIVSQINTTTGIDIPTDDIPGIVEFLNISNINYSLIDLDNDGKIDVFYNQITKFNSSFRYLDDNSILLDLEGDGSWDYIYNFEQKILSIYSFISEDSKSEISTIIPWFLILIPLSILFGCLVLFRDKVSLFIFDLRLSILQKKLYSLSINKRSAGNVHFFSDPQDKKQLINKDFKKLDLDKNFISKPYRFEESKFFDESFKTLDVDTDYSDSYSRQVPHPVLSLCKKIDDKDLLCDNILFKIDLILDIYGEHLSDVGISDIDRVVDWLLFDRKFFLD